MVNALRQVPDENREKTPLSCKQKNGTQISEFALQTLPYLLNKQEIMLLMQAEKQDFFPERWAVEGYSYRVVACGTPRSIHIFTLHHTRAEIFPMTSLLRIYFGRELFNSEGF